MKLIPSIVLNGTAQEAMNYYAGVLDGTITFMERYEECMPDAPESHKQKIVHSSLEFAGNTLFVCDAEPDKPSDLGKNAFLLTVAFDDLNRIQTVYDRFLEGSTIRCELDKTHFAKAYAELTDRFGVTWSLIVE